MQNNPRCLHHRTIESKFGKEAFYETFEEPDGTTTDYLLFGATRVPVIAFPVTADGLVIANYQFRYGANQMGLELPGGVIEDGESSIHTVKNELEEETGYTVEENSIIALHVDGIWFEPASLRTRFLPFLAMNCKPLPQNRQLHEIGEHIEVKLFPVKEWFALLAQGRVRDSKSYCVSILAIKHLAEYKEDARRGLGV